MEWLQVDVLSVGLIIVSILGFITRNWKERLVYLVTVIALLFLIGEEISWGERLFEYEFKQKTSNYQQELNFHNQPVVNEIAALMYIFAFIYALLSWLTRKIVEKKCALNKSVSQWWDIFTFKGSEVIYFVPTFVFNPYADRTIIPGYPPLLDIMCNIGLLPDFGNALNFLAQWRESFEVLFYSAIVLHFLNILIKQKDKLYLPFIFKNNREKAD